eukprot:TRINITY_DN14428_c0_g1_i2.p1 TRINITY_DN14428_c0_g1~~TRINITY_DN14428_c0_g1_i2.p1  ORF type:complete len:174 (-),score=23.66 TRINITY_DN14428_c0_g1_i2:397-918(-)
MKYDSLARVHFMRRRLMNMLPMQKQIKKEEQAQLEEIHVSPLAVKLKKEEVEKREEALVKLGTEHTLNDRRREREPVTLKRDGSKKPGFPGKQKDGDELDLAGLDGVPYHWIDGYYAWHQCSKNELFFRFLLKTYYEHRLQLSASPSAVRKQYLRHRLMRFYIDSIKGIHLQM